jgi:hypothetical protein
LKKLILHISITALFASGFFVAKGQDSVKVIRFRVVNAISGKPVEMAHAINITHRYAAIADLLGYFKMPIGLGDTLTISSLGYFNQEVFNWGQFSKDSIYFTIRLNSRSYELKELKFSWFATYEGFLKGFLQLKLPMTKEERDIARINEYFNRSISRLNLMNLPQATSGVLFGKDWLARQNEKLKEKLEKERQQRAIERKFSAGIVEAITGLTGNEVFWFMEYCAFTNDYLLKSSDYEIRLRITDKFKIYNQDKVVKDKK